jgi:uncharacterized protein
MHGRWLRMALVDALKGRDAVALAALRSAPAAIDNAEAVSTSGTPPAESTSQHVAGAVPGLGAAEVARRRLTKAEMDGVVEHEIAERRMAAAEYERLGDQDRAMRLRAEALVLARVLSAET